jgi:hypothetical protein
VSGSVRARWGCDMLREAGMAGRLLLDLGGDGLMRVRFVPEGRPQEVMAEASPFEDAVRRAQQAGLVMVLSGLRRSRLLACGVR